MQCWPQITIVPLLHTGPVQGCCSLQGGAKCKRVPGYYITINAAFALYAPVQHILNMNCLTSKLKHYRLACVIYCIQTFIKWSLALSAPSRDYGGDYGVCLSK